MRIHTNVLTTSDIHRATTAAAMRGVDAETMTHGSRSHARSIDVTLTGTSTRRPNPGQGGHYRSDDHAATWDEWGMFLAALFAIDPAAIVGTVRSPIYAGADHFHAVTADRFESLTAGQQHGGAGHRWGWSQALGNVCERPNNGKPCDAEMHRIPAAQYLDALKTAQR